MGRNDCGGSIAASAVFIGNVSRAIRTNFDVAMQAAAIEQTVDMARQRRSSNRRSN